MTAADIDAMYAKAAALGEAMDRAALALAYAVETAAEDGRVKLDSRVALRLQLFLEAKRAWEEGMDERHAALGVRRDA